MSDTTPWQSPSGSVPQPPDPFASPGGTPPPPAAPEGAFAGPVTPPTGWTPPPRPGLVPLRPLGLGDILSASFRVMRRNPGPTFGASLVINGIVALINLAILAPLVFLVFGRALEASTTDELAADFGGGAIAASLVGGAITFALGLVATAILQGIISLEVARGTVGERLRFSGLWRQARGRIGMLVLWSLVSTAVAALAVGIVVLLIVLAGTGLGQAGIAVAVLLGLAAAAGFVVLGAWIGTRLSMVPTAIVLERHNLLAAMRRSWTLTGGYFWRTFGIQLLVTVIVSTAAQIVLAPVSFVSSFLPIVLNPTGDPTGGPTFFFINISATTLVSTLVGAITAIISTATVSLIYIDLRMRKEGLDLELARFVEARAAGADRLPDPYLPASSAAVPGATAGGADSPWA